MPLLEVQNLTKHFPISKSVGGLRRVTEQVRAVDGVDLTLDAGETLWASTQTRGEENIGRGETISPCKRSL